MHNLCNLQCEGCSYFVSDRAAKTRTPSDEEYDLFFAGEAARGVTYPIFSGAEPSLNQKVLRIAARHWRYGAVFTNGIRPIEPHLPFRVVVSLWGGRAQAGKLRGANTYDRALRHARADRRAIVFFTINKASIDDISEVVADCAAFGLPISFNFFSMTGEYERRLKEKVANDDTYYRFSTRDENLALDIDDRRRAIDLIEQSAQAFPEVVLFDRSLGRFMAEPGSMHRIDPATGLATDCAILNAASHRSFNYDLSPDDRKHCSAPDFDCADCRVLGAALASLLVKNATGDGPSGRNVSEMIRLRELMMRLYYWDWDQPVAIAGE